MNGLKVSRIGRGEVLSDAQSVAGTFVGEDGEWTTSTGSTPLRVEEGDGVPSVPGVDTIIFDEAGFSVTDNADGSVTIENLGSVPAAGDVWAADVFVDTAGTGGADDVQAALEELYDAVGWTVDTVGAITAGGSPQTIIDDSSHNNFPGLVRLDGTRVLCVYRRGTAHLTGGDIYGQIGTLAAGSASVSSWGTQFLIYSHASEDVRCEDAVSIVDGQVVIAARLYDGSANHDPFILICDDAPADLTDASTWGSPISVPLSAGSVQNYTQGHVHKLASGAYVLGTGHQSAGDHTVGIWKWTGTVDDPSGGSFITVGSGTNDYAEIAVEEPTPGNLLALVRSVTQGDIRKASSSDSGATWGSVSAAYDGYGYPAFRYLLSTQILTVYRDASNGDNMWRTSDDTGATWSAETLLDATGTRSAYASLLQLTPHAILCAYAVEYSADGSTGGADVFAQVFADASTYGATAGGVTFATPAIVLGTAAAAGAAATVIRSDATIVAFDATVPVTQDFGDAAATGSAAVAARRDHVHGMPASPTIGGGGELLVADGTTGPSGITPSEYIEMTTQRTSTSSSLADITGTSVTITTQRTAHLAVYLNCEVSASGASADIGLAVNIDGTDEDVVVTHLSAGSSDSGVSSVIHRTTTALAPGSYTVVGRFKRASGSGTVAVDRADMLVTSLGLSGPVMLTTDDETDYLYADA